MLDLRAPSGGPTVWSPGVAPLCPPPPKDKGGCRCKARRRSRGSAGGQGGRPPARNEGTSESGVCPGPGFGRLGSKPRCSRVMRGVAQGPGHVPSTTLFRSIIILQRL